MLHIHDYYHAPYYPDQPLVCICGDVAPDAKTANRRTLRSLQVFIVSVIAFTLSGLGLLWIIGVGVTWMVMT